ncbi:MAG: GT4 family glycosyltransferase PelF, partial [Bryobacteraceae bacterium]|nr:GT4 family glycosyltransferase PelF [Bryobacteraceae bacterium]
QIFQLKDGAAPEKLSLIPNGIDIARYSAVRPETAKRPPTIALIGRVVPIKDVKTYIRAIAALRSALPDIRAYILGPFDEDPAYYRECQRLVDHLDLAESVLFTGKVSLTEYLAKIDLMVLTSISEAQPLVILEAGAAGVPSVTTDVGACREMIYGRSDEPEQFGAGGAVVPLADPMATAAAILGLLLTPGRLESASNAIRGRVTRYYDKATLDASYAALYGKLFADSVLVASKTAVS